MSPGEIVYRVNQKLEALVQKRGLFIVREAPEAVFKEDETAWIGSLPAIDKTAYCQAADLLMQGHMDIFAIKDAVIGDIPRWNRDPRTGVIAPLSFGKTLNYRNEEIVGDIKYLWEPNRHLQLVRIAQAYALSGNKGYLDYLSKLLNSWFEQCPYLMGPNWTSSLELGIRLINWSIVWQLVGGKNSQLFDGDQGQELKHRWLESIYQHSDFITGHFSRYSSANNHLIGEAAGLYIATVTWPLWPKSNTWRTIAYTILENEAVNQNAEDGVNREQAISYQQFVLDFLILSGIAAKKTGKDFTKQFWQRIEDMLRYVSSVMDVSGNVPMIGDADDGYVVSMDVQGQFCPYRSLLVTGAVLFNSPEFFNKVGTIDDKTRWLLGDLAISGVHGFSAEVKPYLQQEFNKGGYYILGCDFDTGNEIRIVVDSGPLGYLDIAAHGHADALSLSLSVAGEEFLVDPGTYAYHTKKEWRDYFRGTSAHNTIRIDGIDQSQMGGNFMWLSKAVARCEKWVNTETEQILISSHNGYMRLSDSVTHQRKLCFKSKEGVLEVADTIKCRGKHQVERMWHFAEGCEVSRQDQQLIICKNGNSIAINLATPTDCSINIYHGSDSPIFGWISRQFDKKTPVTTVVEKFSVSGTTLLAAKINCRFS